jgi:hypothetical protein
MGFLNSILAGVTLVRESIRSPNYVAGVSGWAIKQDGSAEFNNATIRGNLVAGEIHIGTNPNTFNVDTSGNLWLGAATFAAGLFSVANTGVVSVRSSASSIRMRFTDGSTAPFEWPNIWADLFAAAGSRQVSLSSGKVSALARSAGLILRSADTTPLISYAQLSAQQIDLNAAPAAVTLTVSSTGVAISNSGLSITGSISAVVGIAASGNITALNVSTGQSVVATIQCNSNYNTAASGVWNNANMVMNPGAGNTAVAWHPGGVAPQLRVGNGVDNMFLRNSADSAYVTFTGIIVNVSSRRDKQDIEPWPPPAPMGPAMGLMTAPAPISALERVLALKPSTFRWERSAKLTTVRRRKLTAKAKRDAAKLPEPERLALEFENVEHDCGIDDCAGSAKEPCHRVRDWERPTLGLIAEDVLEVAPELVKLYPDGTAMGLDSIAVAALLVAAVQELAGNVKALNVELGRPIEPHGR